MIIQNTEEELVEQLKNNISNKKYILGYKYRMGSSDYLSNGSIFFNILNKKNLIIYSGYLMNNKGLFVKVLKKAGIKNIILDIHEKNVLSTIKNILNTNEIKDCFITKPYKSSNNSNMCIVIIDLNKIKL